MCALCLALVFLEAFINVLAQALTLAIFVRVIMSWVPLKLPFGLGEFVFAVTEPILGPIRRALPIAGGMDFSPIVAFLLIQVVQAVLLRILPAAIPYSF
jgi:YggT family protein